MHLILIRHGTAENKHCGGDDFHRALAQEGKEESKTAGRILKKLGLTPSLILTSPLLRAKQTAEAAAAAMGPGPVSIIEEGELAPAGDAGALLKHLKVLYRDHQTIALAGHQPFMGELMSKLIFGRVVDEMPFPKGGVAVFSVDGSLAKGMQKLVFAASPREAQKLLG
jgi:phosphohistidine phosphatase